MKITLCGSTKFMERFNELNRELSKQGHIVYSVAAFGHSGDVLTPEEKTVLDLVHLQKIDESDAIVVIGAQPDGTFYLGESTRREVQWATMKDKMIYTDRGLGFLNEPLAIETHLKATVLNLPKVIQTILNSQQPNGLESLDETLDISSGPLQ